MTLPTLSRWGNFTSDKIRANLELAESYGLKNGTCERLRVGCAIYSPTGGLLALGANNSPIGVNSCDSAGHLIIGGHCHRTIHAEQNAVGFATTRGINLLNAVVFLSHTPCLHCAKLLIACSVSAIIYKNEYDNVVSKEALKELSEKTGIFIGKYN